jgi:hypothetical protein
MRCVALLLLTSTLCGCGCTCGSKAEPPAAAVEAPRPATPALKPPPSAGPAKASADPVAEVASLSPHQVIVAAEAAHDDAAGYVAWRESKPTNIERLTVLTRDLDGAITRMRAHEVGHKYPPGDVFAARAALRALRLFLREKGD